MNGNFLSEEEDNTVFPEISAQALIKKIWSKGERLLKGGGAYFKIQSQGFGLYKSKLIWKLVAKLEESKQFDN